MSNVAVMKSLLIVSAEDIREYLSIINRATKLGAIISIIEDASGVHFAIDYRNKVIYKNYVYDVKNYISFLESIPVDTE